MSWERESERTGKGDGLRSEVHLGTNLGSAKISTTGQMII